MRRFRDGGDSDGSRGVESESSNNSCSCVDLSVHLVLILLPCPGHYEDLKRNRDELDINLKQYRKHYNLLKDDHEQLKRKVRLLVLFLFHNTTY